METVLKINKENSLSGLAVELILIKENISGTVYKRTP